MDLEWMFAFLFAGWIAGCIVGWTSGQFVKGLGFGRYGNIVAFIAGAMTGGYLLPNIALATSGGDFAGIVAPLVVGWIGGWITGSSSGLFVKGRGFVQVGNFVALIAGAMAAGLLLPLIART